VLVHHPGAMAEADRPVGMASLRGIETEVLLRAITALRAAGMLSEAEYQAKRQRLAARR
jgi:hypothetical protein